MNIIQQVAASIGTALFSVLLTNGFNEARRRAPARRRPERQRHGRPGGMTEASPTCRTRSLPRSRRVVLVALCLVPAWFLPRSKPAKELDPAAAMGA